MFSRWALQPWFDGSVKKGYCVSVDVKDKPFLDFWIFPPLWSSDWGYCLFVFKYHWKGRICNQPIGIVFSRDAGTPIRDISNLGVVCVSISMS